MHGSGIWIICALEAEAGAVRKRLGGRSEVRVVVSGVGPRRAAMTLESLLNVEHPARVIAAGFAGALDPALRTGAVIRFDQVIDAATGITYGLPGPDSSCLVTVTDPAHTLADKAALRQQYDAHAVDMETAAIARICTQRDIPWRAVRAITDAADQSLPPEFAALVDERGRSRTLGAVGLILRRPSLILALLRLGRAARRAARALAERLAELLQTGDAP